MSIEKFEVGKSYRFLKNGGEEMYYGVDAIIGQEFTVCEVDNGDVYSKDVTFEGKEDLKGGWVVHGNSLSYIKSTLDDFEEVIKDVVYRGDSQGSLDIVYTLTPSDVGTNLEETISVDLIKEVTKLQQELNLMLMFHGGEVTVNFENNDTEYKISSQEELTTLIEASKVLQQFERKQ